ncbi:MAG: T9SS type A sorting domain-containing protein [Bacteroidales bacterium]|nr:T9SS type A sorting domain-containing protein [Bacteroidales bacterium]
MNDEYAFVGAYLKSGVGAVYVYKNTNGYWQQTQMLLPTTTGVEYFGSSVNISGNYAIVGAYGSNGSRRAYFYKNISGTWQFMQKLYPSDGEYGDFFGWTVSMSNDYALVGAFHHNVDVIIDTTNTDSDLIIKEGIMIYPNPTTGVFYINAVREGKLIENLEVEVTDMVGRILFMRKKFNQANPINLSWVENASYIVIIKTETDTYKFKFIKVE